MNRLIHAKVTKSLCHLIVFAMVSSFFGAAIAKPASAQAASVPQSYTVAVVDFVNESRVQSDLLARMATDAVVLEMSKMNRYDVGFTRSQIKAEMEKLDLRPPLNREGLVRLGDSLSADALLQGSLVKIWFTGQGSNRSANVTLAIQMIDRASGEIVNGALQTGQSSARVGYTADDDALLTEAINSAAYLAVKQISDYVIPEATIHNNLGIDQVVINKGARQGIKLGMRMIVLRDKEIIGYIQITRVTPNDATARVLKSLRGVQPEDKVRGIYDMPTVTPSLKSEPLPSGAPSSSKTGQTAIQKVAKFVASAAVVFLVARLISGGRGNESGPLVGTGDTNTVITWDPTKFGHGKGVWEYQILRMDDYSVTNTPVAAFTNSTVIDSGKFDVRYLYGTSTATPVTFYDMATNPSSTAPTQSTGSVPAEAYGKQHSYVARVLYETSATDGTKTYHFSQASGTIKATAIEPVLASDLLQPEYNTNTTAPAILLNELSDGTMNFRWNRKDGANAYYVVVEPIYPGTMGTWNSQQIGGDIFESGPTVELTTAQRINLADFLTKARVAADTVLKWTVYCRNTTDTSTVYTKGEEGRFTVNELPPDTP